MNQTAYLDNLNPRLASLLDAAALAGAAPAAVQADRHDQWRCSSHQIRRQALHPWENWSPLANRLAVQARLLDTDPMNPRAVY